MYKMVNLRRFEWKPSFQSLIAIGRSKVICKQRSKSEDIKYVRTELVELKMNFIIGM